MSTFVLLTITGLGLGAMYFLVASGLSLIYGLMGVLNFAHGALAELREELVHEVVPWVRASLREPEVLLDGQPGEDVPVLRDVADAAPHHGVRWQPRDVLAVE